MRKQSRCLFSFFEYKFSLNSRMKIAGMIMLQTQVEKIGIKCRTNKRAMNNLFGIIKYNLNSHCMTSMFRNTNKATANFSRLAWKSMFLFILENINRLPKGKHQERANISHSGIRYHQRSQKISTN